MFTARFRGYVFHRSRHACGLIEMDRWPSAGTAGEGQGHCHGRGRGPSLPGPGSCQSSPIWFSRVTKTQLQNMYRVQSSHPKALVGRMDNGTFHCCHPAGRGHGW